jgi:hypothetical protein
MYDDCTQRRTQEHGGDRRTAPIPVILANTSVERGCFSAETKVISISSF